MKLRQPNRRRFKSQITERRRRQREYYYASISVLVVKIILFIFLAVLFSVSLRLFHYRFQNLTPVLRYSVPALVGLFDLILAFFIYRNFKDIRELSKDRRQSP